jgi:SPP1 family holin
MKVSTDTIIRTIVLVIALVNQVLTSMGKNPLPFSDDVVYEAVTLAVTIGASAWAWWKNNSFTQNALQADEYLKELRTGGTEVEES